MAALQRILLPATLAGVLSLSAHAALSGEYLVDDSFISYRYAERFVRGLGLTFNTGERVEGYTNFLWVLLSAAMIAAGLDPAAATRMVGVAALLATVCLVFVMRSGCVPGTNAPADGALLRTPRVPRLRTGGPVRAAACRAGLTAVA